MIADTVLLVTASYDFAAEYVGDALKRRGIPFFRLDTDRFPSQVRVSFDPHEDTVISSRDHSILGKQIRSVWYRRNVAPDLPESLDADTREFCERETHAFLEGTLATLPSDRWLSSPQAIWRAERKPYQLAIAARLGFMLPRTVVTNDEVSVRQMAQNNRLVAKAVSSGYISGPEGNRAIFTSALVSGDLEDLGGLSLAPVTFQELVEKVSDIRVTVVGNDVFAAEILSQRRESSRVDWRATDDVNLEHKVHKLPPKVDDLCRKLVSHLGLAFGAIDLALKADGTYTFFEINPNGEWGWIEDKLGLPISDHIAQGDHAFTYRIVVESWYG